MELWEDECAVHNCRKKATVGDSGMLLKGGVYKKGLFTGEGKG